jgi:hypothetical protein
MAASKNLIMQDHADKRWINADFENNWTDANLKDNNPFLVYSVYTLGSFGLVVMLIVSCLLIYGGVESLG